MTLVPRGTKWGVKVWDAGKRRYRWIGTFATEAEAISAERDATVRPGGETPTVEQWARIWLSDYARPAPATQQTYRYAVEQIKRELGKLRLSELDRPRARKLANQWPRNTSRVARTMWADGVRDGLCEVNPWTNLRLETPKGRKDIDALTEDEIAALADVAERTHGDYGLEVRAIVVTLGYTGMRPGELCALRRADLDWQRGEIVVSRSLDGTGREKRPKNGKARKIVLAPQAAEAIRSVPELLGSPYVFHSSRGHRLTKGTLAYAWRLVAAAWRQAGGRDIDLYELRHACATLLLERGLTPADVAAQLGHTDGGRLVQVLYGHPSEDAALDRVRMALSAPQRSQSVRRHAGRGAA